MTDARRRRTLRRHARTLHRQLDNIIREFLSQSTIVAIDRIFTATGSLSGQAIVHFVRSLCAISLEEVELQPKPRMYSLQKVCSHRCLRVSVDDAPPDCRVTVRTPPWRGRVSYCPPPLRGRRRKRVAESPPVP